MANEQQKAEFVVKGCLTRLALAFQFSSQETFTRDEVVLVILGAWHAYEQGKAAVAVADALSGAVTDTLCRQETR